MAVCESEARALVAHCESDCAASDKSAAGKPVPLLLILHDPQTLGMAATIAALLPHAKIVWRCHIGLPASESNAAANGIWCDFLEPMLSAPHIAAVVVSSHAYIRASFAKRSFVIQPGLSPLEPKVGSTYTAVQCLRWTVELCSQGY